MSAKLQSVFSLTVDGVIWKMITDPGQKRLFLEVRDNVKKNVSFDCVELDKGSCLWRNLTFDEPWWISLQTVANEILLFTLYSDTNNPDKKSLLAYHVIDQKMIWWRNDFSYSFVSGDVVVGSETKFGSAQIGLRLIDGREARKDAYVSLPEQNFMITRPFQYHEGNSDFDTVRSFLEMKVQISPIISIEYCEYHSLILISTFVNPNDLANYLFVFNSEGEVLAKETLGEHLRGIALDTFFVFAGFLIFVKNKCELVSYKIV